MKKNVKDQELKNVAGGMEPQDFTGDHDCWECGSSNRVHKTKSSGCSTKDYWECQDCGNQWEV